MTENCMQVIPFWYATPFMRFLYMLILMVAITVSLFARDKKPVPVAERLAAQKVLFDEQYESDLHEFPERATELSGAASGDFQRGILRSGPAFA